MLITQGDRINYEYEMCHHGKPQFLLSYQLTKLPEGYLYTYTDSNLKGLWLEEAPCMSLHLLKGLLTAFVGLVRSCKAFLLDFQHVQLSLEHCYVNDGLEVGYTYMPFESRDHQDLGQRLEGWLKSIYQHVDMNNEEVIQLLHPMGIAIASDHLSLEGFAGAIEVALGRLNE